MDWRHAFAALPVEAPSTDGWNTIASRLPVSAAPRAPRRPHMRWQAAAAVLIAAIGALVLLTRTVDAPRATDGATRLAMRDAVAPSTDRATASPTARTARSAPAIAAQPRSMPVPAARDTPTTHAAPRKATRLAVESVAQRRTDKSPAAQRSARPTDTTLAEAAANGASAHVATDTTLQALRAESARLETLAALARDDRLASGPSMVLAANAEDRVRLIDAVLSRGDVDDARQLDLWARRVDALRELAGVEGTTRWLAAQGESLQGAIALVD